jgi:uncharacterized protein (DUF1330 family)
LIAPRTSRVSRGFAQVTVRIPLTGLVSQEWLSFYQAMAHKWAAHEGDAFLRRGEGVMEAQGQPDRSWIVIRLPATLDRAVVQSVLNAAREMIAEADAAEQAPQAAETEAAVREWWAGQ